MSKDSIISIGIVGAGSRILHVYKDMHSAAAGQVRIASFYDISPEQAAQVRAAPGGADAVASGSAEQVVSDPSVTAVMIGSPNAFHTEPAICAMEAGKPLYLEKPLATTLDDHDRLLRVYERTRARVAVGFVLRYAPFYKKVKEMSAELGKILFLQASEHMGIDLTAYCYLRGWRAYRRFAGPLLLEKCCHDIDIINWILDAPCKWVAAAGSRTAFIPRTDRPEKCRACPDPECAYRHYGTRPYTDAAGERIYGADENAIDWCVYNREKDIDDHTTMLAEYEGGRHVSFNVTMGAARGERRIRIVGTRGVLTGCAEDNAIEFTPLRRDAKPEAVSPGASAPGGHFGGDTLLAAGFIRLIRDPSAKPGPSIPEGYRSGVICLAADAAAASGRRIEMSGFLAGKAGG